MKRCCERCGVPSECEELRTRWFCERCYKAVKAMIFYYQVFTERYLMSIGLM